MESSRSREMESSSSSCVGEESLREIERERERGVRGRERVGFEVETELGSRSRERESCVSGLRLRPLDLGILVVSELG